MKIYEGESIDSGEKEAWTSIFPLATKNFPFQKSVVTNTLLFEF